MSNLAEKRERFDRLLNHAQVPQDMIQAFFSDGHIEKVAVSRSHKEWVVHLSKKQVVPCDMFASFCRQIADHFSGLVQVRFVLGYDESVEDSVIAEEYWPLFVEKIQREEPSINGLLAKARITAAAGEIRLYLLDDTALELARKKNIPERVGEFYLASFRRRFRVLLDVSETGAQELERFVQRIQEEEQEMITRELAAAPDAAASSRTAGEPAELQFGYPIRDEPVPLADIREEEKRAVVQGAVFQLEKKELKNGSTLFQFNVTDYTDSITVKVFGKSKEDVRILELIANGKWVKVRGRVEYDRFMQVPELVMIASDIQEMAAPPDRMDDAEEKRVEFHAHTSMSTMDGIPSAGEVIELAAKWGHKAVAITDHANVQSFPEAYKYQQKTGIKVIYGVEANIVNDAVPVALYPDARELHDAEFVIFDIETTGLSVTQHKIIEIAGVKMREGRELARFQTFVNPHERIPYHIVQLTGITDDMVSGGMEAEDALREFCAFAEGAVLVAHNANFDIGFVQENLKRFGMVPLRQPVIDTLELARLLHPNLKNHRLNTLADTFKVPLENHHRAIDDSAALGHILFHLLKDARERGIHRVDQLNDYVGKDLSNARPFHATIYAKNQTGKKNLFKLVSLSHTDYFNRVPCIPKSVLTKYREGLIIASGCDKGELFETVLNKSPEEAEEVAAFYDVLEVQPPAIYMHLVDKDLATRQQLADAVRTIVEIGRKLGKPVIATGNAHYLHPRDKIFREITIHGITGYSPLKEIRRPDVHFRTTREMLEEFSFLGEELAHEIVVASPNRLADEIEVIEMFPKQPFYPVIEGADEEMRETCYATAKRIYGDPLPDIVRERLEKEIVPITKAGYAALYLIAARLVKKSNEDGYLVGSRGSVGSSIVAMMLGISEVNPLQPHYLCPSCKHSEWFTDGSVGSGFDLPDKPCPRCGATMKGDGQDIPFETFLGFKGDKVPDIDLNFSGEYQAQAHNYTKVLFGEKNVFRAGTIGTVAEKTAYGFVKKYEEEHGKKWRQAELSRLAAGCTGVKRSTGQHPGGIVVVPDYIEVEDITPVQFPADDTSSEWKTTHFDYHAFDANLLKLDILGHDDPTMMRMLQDLTGVDPTKIPMNDPKVMSLFSSTEALGVTPGQIRTPVATYGIPEMGTKFVRQMLEETKPSTFADLLQISGLSHGTGVWLGNAQELIRQGICTISTVIGCRDNIMLYLIYRGMEAGLAFTITESVRKGKGLKPEWIEEMKKHDVPDWYIESCQKIEYMFPRAHAAAYVTSAVRTAYFKLYHPIEFYAAYFSVRCSEDFDIDVFCQGYDGILKKLLEIEEKGFAATAKEKSMVSVLEMGLEMTARGFSFKPIDLYRSDAVRFTIDGDALIPPFSAIAGIGTNAAKNIAAAREEGPFLSVEDFQVRTKATKTVVEILSSMGCFRGIPESNQLSLF